MRIDVEASKDTESAVIFGQQLYEVVSRIDADLNEILREHKVEDKVRVKDMHGLTFEWAGWVRNLDFCATMNSLSCKMKSTALRNIEAVHEASVNALT